MLTFLLCLPFTTTAQIQKFLLHPTSQFINSHKRNLSLLQQHPEHKRNSAVYATLEPFLSSLHPDERETFQNSFEEARRYSRHERFYRESERDRILRGRQLQMYSDPPISAESDVNSNDSYDDTDFVVKDEKASSEGTELNGNSNDSNDDTDSQNKARENNQPAHTLNNERKRKNESPLTSSPQSPITSLPHPVTKRGLIEGGLLNTYQPAPLLQGYGTHYATVWVGTPPQRKSVIVDTGSHYTAFPCVGCNNCGEENHTDRYFDPGLSSTFHALRCDECVASRCEGGRCTFSQMYTEGSSWQAYQVKDRFYVGKNQLFGRDDPVDNSFAIPFMFGCQTSETGLFVTQLADGIMGMSCHEATLPKQMYNQGKIQHNMFTMCFRRELTVSKQGVTAGIMTLGGIDTRLHSSPMLYTKNVVKNGWFTVYVRNVFLRKDGGVSARPDRKDAMIIRLPLEPSEINSGKGVIVDSGTTDTYLHKSLAAGFSEAWKSATGVSYSNTAVRLTQEQLMALPTILIQLGAYDSEGHARLGDSNTIVGLAGDMDPRRPTDVILAVPAAHYMEYSPSKDVYTSRLYFTETRGGVIGANAMQGHDVLFDWENSRVGFAESSCDYGLLQENIDDSPEKEIDAGVVVDCELSQPSLVTSCAQSVDDALVKCQNVPKDTTLDGSEKWVWVVENAGTTNGMRCEEVAMKQAQNQNLVADDEVITALECEDNGLCYMAKKCSASCHDLLKSPPKEAKGGGVACGDNRWGACTSACVQSRITSILMDDGNCHEVISEVKTRPCHVQECGREDPCRVPFVVHAVFGLVGANPKLWNIQAEEQFVGALARTSRDMQVNDDNNSLSYFGAGDVTVLMVSEWHHDPSIAQGVPVEPGLKIIVEISIFNPTAKIKQAGTDNPTDSDISANTTLSGIVAVLDKINFLKEKDEPLKATCKEEELYPFAKNALAVHTNMQSENFISQLINAMSINSNDDSTPFRSLQEPQNIQKSKVLTSWTIKTEIGGELSLYDHSSDDLLRGSFKNVMKGFLSDGWLLFGVTMILLAFLLVGAKCGYNFGARDQLKKMSVYSSKLINKLRSKKTEEQRGRYSPLEDNDVVLEATELELT